MKKSANALSIDLSPTLDIMQEVGGLSERPFTVGFAAETEQVDRYAQEKRQRKNMDMIAANQVGTPNSGFEVDDNQLNVYWADGEQQLPHAPKTRLARQLVGLISQQYRVLRSPQHDGPSTDANPD